jgi:hypothetical protein
MKKKEQRKKEEETAMMKMINDKMAEEEQNIARIMNNFHGCFPRGFYRKEGPLYAKYMQKIFDRIDQLIVDTKFDMDKYNFLTSKINELIEKSSPIVSECMQANYGEKDEEKIRVNKRRLNLEAMPLLKEKDLYMLCLDALIFPIFEKLKSEGFSERELSG